jgi:hypothetical protein
VVTCQPLEPDVIHVWVRGHGGHGTPTPGVVVGWQHAPVHNATAAAWIALVATAPFSSALLVQWVSAERLIPVRDPAAVDGPR